MITYELPKAVDLFSSQVNTANNLWTVYVAATFAAAGFGHNLDPQSLVGRLAITFGFWAFTLGHLHLLRQALSILQSLGASITKVIKAQFQPDTDANDFTDALQRLALSTNRPQTGIAIHLFIDVCVTVAIWAQYVATQLAPRSST